MRLTRFACAAAVALAAIGCTSIVRSHVFHPQPMPAKISWGTRAPQDVVAAAADGLKLRGYYWPPQAPDGDVIVFFHGQSGNRYTAARMAAPLAERGGVLVASYRGYGDNPGVPDESGIYADARAFLALARTLAPHSRIYLVGFSLGAAPALHTAAEEQVAGVITIGAFTSLRDVAPTMGRGLLRDRFDNRESIARVSEPVLILHGTVDDVVPFAQAEALRAIVRQGRLLRMDRVGHVPDFEWLAPIIWDNIKQMPQ